MEEMKIVLTAHAKIRMRGRSVTLGEVRDALRAIEIGTIPVGVPQLVRRKVGMRILEIVFRRKSQTFIIITLYEI